MSYPYTQRHRNWAGAICIGLKQYLAVSVSNSVVSLTVSAGRLWLASFNHQTTLVSSCRVLVACWYFCCWPAMDSRTTTSRGWRERQAAPHGRLPPAFALVFIPHAFSSVKISVKKPGSALMRSMFDDSRFTISKHLPDEVEGKENKRQDAAFHLLCLSVLSEWAIYGFGGPIRHSFGLQAH
uniref:Uncharacterized protein n=1 Tax=Anopheles farauti TaxID=69004 RepID=A0A182QM69_9DIPT